MKPASLGLAFVLELAALAALAYWGWGVTWGLAIAAPAAWVVLWAVFGSPKARVKLSPSQHLAFEVVMFGSAAVALWAAGQPVWAIGFVAVWAVNRSLTAARGY